MDFALSFGSKPSIPKETLGSALRGAQRLAFLNPQKKITVWKGDIIYRKYWTDEAGVLNFLEY